MKRLISTSLAAALAMVTLGTAEAVAQPYQHPGDHDYYYNHPNAHRWHHGDRFYGDRHPVDWRYHHLYAPPYGYEWVDGGGAFLLLNIGTGYVANVVVY